MNQFKLLDNDEIDVRISQIGKQYVSLLMYIDARAAMNKLDESVGAMNWKKEYTKGNANCIVSIWDSDKAQWISKEDTGKESFTEKEKGLASDSFKRACVNWGIGRELYTAPCIKCRKSLFNIIKGDGDKEKCYDSFVVKEIGYDDSGNIIKLKIANEETNVVVFDMGYKTTTDKEENEAYTDTFIETKHVISLMKKCGDDKVDSKKICEKYGVKTLNNLRMSQLNEIVKNWTSVIKKECAV